MMLPLLLPLSLLAAAEATYSIVATDAETRQVGGAGATCIPSKDIFAALYHAAPNRSVLHTQGMLLQNDVIETKALEMMEKGESIDNVLAMMRELDTGNNEYFPQFANADLRQYGMADFNSDDSDGGFTGKSLEALYEMAEDALGIKADETEQIDFGMDRNDDFAKGRYSFHAQGNVVAKGTVSSLYDGFLVLGDGCDMAENLMAAMATVVENGQGDMRCINGQGVSATGAFLHIDNPDGTEYIHINVIGDGTFEPVEQMRQDFLAWREDNPCPVLAFEEPTLTTG